MELQHTVLLFLISAFLKMKNTIIPDREASLSREKTHTALAEWISCCMSEDAPEESGEVSCLFLAAFD
jgi:hypothetical protein